MDQYPKQAQGERLRDDVYLGAAPGNHQNALNKISIELEDVSRTLSELISTNQEALDKIPFITNGGIIVFVVPHPSHEVRALPFTQQIKTYICYT